MIKPLTSCIICLGLALGAILKADTTRINTQVAFFPLSGQAWRGVYYAPDGDPARGLTSIRFNPLERTLYMPYTGPRQFALYVKARDADNRELHLPVASVTLEETSRQILLVQDTGQTLGERYPGLRFADDLNLGRMASIAVFPDTPRTFPPNSLVFFNATGAEFVGVLADQPIRLKPGLNPPLTLTPYLDEEITVGLAIQDGDTLRRVLAGKSRFSPDRRTLMILRPPANEGSWRIRTQRLTEYLGERAGES